MNEPEKKTKTAYLELLRIIACFFVIVNHTSSGIFLSRTPNDKTWWVSVTYFFACKVAVPIFLMISGTLMLGKIDDYKKYFFHILLKIQSIVLNSYRNKNRCPFDEISQLIKTRLLGDFCARPDSGS